MEIDWNRSYEELSREITEKVILSDSNTVFDALNNTIHYSANAIKWNISTIGFWRESVDW